MRFISQSLINGIKGPFEQSIEMHDLTRNSMSFAATKDLGAIYCKYSVSYQNEMFL